MTEKERELFERVVVWLDMPQTGHPKRLIDDINQALADTEDKMDTGGFVDVVFDGPPGHESGRFVECENVAGASIHAGDWIDRGDGLWALRISRLPPKEQDVSDIGGMIFSERIGYEKAYYVWLKANPEIKDCPSSVMAFLGSIGRLSQPKEQDDEAMEEECDKWWERCKSWAPKVAFKAGWKAACKWMGGK